MGDTAWRTAVYGEDVASYLDGLAWPSVLGRPDVAALTKPDPGGLVAITGKSVDSPAT